MGDGEVSKAKLQLVSSAPPTAADKLRKKVRKRLRDDVRPAPGTSDLLGRPFDSETFGGDRVYHDWTALIPVHFRGGVLDRETRKI